MTQELVITGQQNNALAVTLSNFDDCLKLAAVVVKSGLAPKELNTPEKAAVAMLHGAELGLAPMNALQSIAVINGRPCLWGDTMLALCCGHPEWEGIEETFTGSGETFEAVCVVNRKGRAPRTQHWTLAMAKKAGLTGKPGPWTNYPQRMLQLRARSWALRDMYPDALRGMRCAEEVIDYEPGTVADALVTDAANDAPVTPAEIETTKAELVDLAKQAGMNSKSLDKFARETYQGKGILTLEPHERNDCAKRLNSMIEEMNSDFTPEEQEQQGEDNLL